MPHRFSFLFALAALLCSAPLHAQAIDAVEVEDIAALADNPMVGVWAGIEMAGMPLDEGDFFLTVNADGTGDVVAGGGDPEPYTYTYDEETQVFVVTPEEGEPFSFTMTFDGDTATMEPDGEGGPPPIVLQRVVADDDGEAMPDGAMPPAPELADMSDSPLVGRWALVSFNGEAPPEDVNLQFENHADGTGTSFENGEPGDTYTWQHDFDTGIATFVHGDGESMAFTFVIENGVATYVSTDETMTIVERRVDTDPPAGAIPPAPAPVDLSDSPLVGRWALVSYNGEDLPEEVDVEYENRADGSGMVFESGEPTNDYQWRHDLDTGKVTVMPTGEPAMEFTLVMQDDLAIFVSTDETMRFVERRVGDVTPSPLVGDWSVLSIGEIELEAGALTLRYHADGSGFILDNGDPKSFTWTHNPYTGQCTIGGDHLEAPHEYILEFRDGLGHFVPAQEDGQAMPIIARKLEAQPADADPIIGTWRGLSMGGEPFDDDEVFELTFKADGTGALKDGGTEDEPLTYTYDPATELYTLVIEEEESIAFAATFVDAQLTMTPVDEDGPPMLVLERIAQEDAQDNDANDDEPIGGAMEQDGVIGTWYAQKMEGEWIPTNQEFRLDFRADGTVEAYENGESEGGDATYFVNEEQGTIDIMEGSIQEVSLRYILFDEVMILTFEDRYGEGVEMEILLTRTPEGTEEHQQERAAVGDEEDNWDDAAPSDARGEAPDEAQGEADPAPRGGHFHADGTYHEDPPADADHAHDDAHAPH